MPRVASVPLLRRARWPALLIGSLAPLLAPAQEAASPAPAPAVAATPFAADTVRAAYIVNFIRFTEWPAEGVNSGPLVVGVAGNRALEDELIRIADRQLVHGRRLHVIRIRTLRDLEACEVVFFNPAPTPGDDTYVAPAEGLRLLASSPVLTISESPDFIALGGMINLYRERENLRFEIAPETARKAGLFLSSRLLSLARIVRPSPEAATP